MGRLSLQDRAKILACLVEGNSIRATCRMTGAAKGTVIKLLADVGAGCKDFHDKHVRNVPSKRVRCDEIWSFCYAKVKNVPEHFKGTFGFGDVWIWTALRPDSKQQNSRPSAGFFALGTYTIGMNNGYVVPVTLTIKQVPDGVARRLRERAKANRRSLQGELMAVLESALATSAGPEQPHVACRANKPKRALPAEAPLHQRKLTLAELWEAGRKMGLKSRSESTRIIRKMRDERYGG